MRRTTDALSSIAPSVSLFIRHRIPSWHFYTHPRMTTYRLMTSFTVPRFSSTSTVHEPIIVNSEGSHICSLPQVICTTTGALNSRRLRGRGGSHGRSYGAYAAAAYACCSMSPDTCEEPPSPAAHPVRLPGRRQGGHGVDQSRAYVAMRIGE